jgi:hypothetical protein
MLDALFVAPAVATVADALDSARAEGPLAVIGHARLASELAAHPRGYRTRGRGSKGNVSPADDVRTVVAVGLSERAAKKVPRALTDLSSVADRTLAGVIAVDITTDDAWEAHLRDYKRVVRDGGAIVLVDRRSALPFGSAARSGGAGPFDRGRAPEASRRALCGGLTELEQRHAGRVIVTSGLVTHL